MLGEKKRKRKKGEEDSLAYQSLDDIYQMKQNTLRGSQLLIISKKPTTTVEMKKGKSKLESRGQCVVQCCYSEEQSALGLSKIKIRYSEEVG